MKTFGEKLRDMRMKKGLSQVKLAEKSGIPQVAISHYELGKHIPTITALEWLVGALDTTSTELLGF